MGMRRVTLFLGFMAPLALVAAAFVALARAEPSLQPGTEASGCTPDLQKWAEPQSLILGQTAKISLVVSGTCPMRYLPVDLVIISDESNSMTRKSGGGIIAPTEAKPTDPKPETPDPQTPPPTPPDPGGISTPIGPGTGKPGGEPPFCNPSGGGGIIAPTIVKPTDPKPETPDPRTPPATPPNPGGVVPPGTTPGGGSTGPGQDIEELEPSGAVDWVREEKSWIRDFMSQPEIERDIQDGRLRVGFVSFNERARIKQPLTDSSSKIIGAANRMRGGEVTYFQQAVRAAEQMLRGSGSRKDVERVQVVILMSDFQFCIRDVRPFDRDIEVISVGFGVRTSDQRNMYQLATDRRFVLQNRDLRGVLDVYERVIAKGSAVDVDELVVRDELNNTMALVPNSVQPPTVTVSGQLLEWTFTDPVLPMTLTYEVEPLDPGTHLVSRQAGIGWRDSESLIGAGTFPTVTLDVIPPTPTPTNTPTNTPTPTATYTPTPTHTPTPADRYFPIALRQAPPPTPTPGCVPESQLVDVALVIDTSTSMNDPTQAGGVRKIDAAIDAAIGLVELLKPADQTAVVWFNSSSGLSSVLTSDKAQAIAALQSLPTTTARGTMPNLGINTATDELTSVRHNPTANSSLILLTDGRATVPAQLVRDAADRAKAADIQIVTVGLGSDVDSELLTEIASEPDLYFHAPNAEDLEAIYVEIANLIPCP